jgi:pyruvate/2-oxoglutarate dehydrogenase complex dihydrolipoamide acyltransferase (E2) component
VLLEAASGRQVASFRPMQRVWVRLSADGSRAHGPRLRLRLLADQHPQAAEAAAREAPSAPTARAAAGCNGGPVKAGWARAGYRPPGFGAPQPAAAAPAASAAPAAPAEPAAPAPASNLSEPLGSRLAEPAGGVPVGPLSLAGQLHAFLEQQQGSGREQGGAAPSPHPLDCQATPPPLDRLPGGSSSGGASPAPAVLQRAVRQLHARAARLSLLAGARAPGAAKAERCRAEAAELRQRILSLQQQLVPG